MAGKGQRAPSTRRLRFGAFELDTAAEELIYRGNRVHAQEMPLKVLAMLLERPGELVRREELFERLWPDDELGILDDNLNVALHKLRVALGDEASRPNYIETVPRKGYRFIATVSEAPAETEDKSDQRPGSAHASAGPGADAPRPSPGRAKETPRSRRRIRLGIASVVAVVFGVFAWTHFSTQILQTAPAPDLTAPTTLAVLPFVNLSDDPGQEFFSDGLTEELLATLARLPDLRVISRTSVMRYKGSDQPLTEIAGELGATHVLEGSVRRANGRLRITAQLIDAATDHHLWAEAYDRDLEDIFAIQSEIATEIASALDTSFAAVDPSPFPIDAPPTTDLEAYHLYLQGRYLVHNYFRLSGSDSVLQALKLYDQALERDPDFAPVWAAKGTAYTLLLNFPRGTTGLDNPADLARASIRRALELEAGVAEAWRALALVQMAELDWIGAEASLLNAIAADPGFALAHHSHGVFLVSVGKSHQAKEVLLKAAALDPVNASTAHWLADAFRNTGRLEDARIQAERSVELGALVSGIGVYIDYLLRGQWEEAISYQEGIFDSMGVDAIWVRPIVEAVRDPARVPEAIEVVRAAQAEHPDLYYPAYFYLDLADPELAFDGIDDLIDRGLGLFAFWRLWEPQFTHLRNHPRFLEIAERAGLLEYWRERGWPDLCRPDNGGFVCD